MLRPGFDEVLDDGPHVLVRIRWVAGGEVVLVSCSGRGLSVILYPLLILLRVFLFILRAGWLTDVVIRLIC